MRKVKIIKAYSRYIDYDQDYEQVLYPVTTDWEEVDDDEFWKIYTEVDNANANSKLKDSRFILIEYGQRTTDEMYKLASEFRKDQEKKRILDEKRREDEKAKREAKAAERKRKQLEKLKRELGEE